MATGMPPITIYVPRLEDEISQAWDRWLETALVDDLSSARDGFEAGFRAVRTITFEGAAWQA